MSDKNLQLPFDPELQDLILTALLNPKQAVDRAMAWVDSGLNWDEVKALPKPVKENLAATIVALWGAIDAARDDPKTLPTMKFLMGKLITGMFVHAVRQRVDIPPYFREESDDDAPEA